MIKIGRVLNGLLVGAASVLLLLLLAITTVDVLGRNLFNQPLPGAGELTELALVGLSFLAYPLVSFKAKHITIDLLSGVLPAFARTVQVLLTGLIGVAVFGALAWRLWKYAERTAADGDTTVYLHVPMSPVYGFMSVMSVVTALAFAGAMIVQLWLPQAAPTGHKPVLD